MFNSQAKTGRTGIRTSGSFLHYSKAASQCTTCATVQGHHCSQCSAVTILRFLIFEQGALRLPFALALCHQSCMRGVNIINLLSFSPYKQNRNHSIIYSFNGYLLRPTVC